MKKKYFLGIIVLFCSVAGFSQDAKTILNDVAHKVKSATTITARFSYTVKDKNGNSGALTTGNLTMKGDKYYIKQGKDEIYCNAKKIWNYDGEQEVLVAEADKGNNSEEDYTPAKMMAVDYNKDYTYQVVATAADAYTIRLVPVDKRKPVKSIDVYADRQRKMITKAIIEDKAGNTTNISFTDITLNNSVPDDIFVFSMAKHPGVEVIEQ